MLRAEYLPQFGRDAKKLARKHRNLEPLEQAISLVLQGTSKARKTLKRRHKVHALKDVWTGSRECHVTNAGSWLVIWKTGNGLAVLQHTGSHDEPFA